MFNFRGIWRSAIILTAISAILPLVIISAVDYKMTQKSIESEIRLTTSRTVSNTKRSVSYYLAVRKNALDFIVQDNLFEELRLPHRLSNILDNLRESFGDVSDIGVIDAEGRQVAYIGPYNLEGRDYSGQEWFKKVLKKGIFISDVFLGFRNVPHIVIAVKHRLQNGSFYVLRSSIDTERFNEQLSILEMHEKSDAFIINREGVLQTPSRYNGDLLGKLSFPVPAYSPRTEVFQDKTPSFKKHIIGYAYIPDTSFILMIVKQKSELMKIWRKSRNQIIGFLSGSIIFVLLVIIGFATYMVNNMYMADQKRLSALHEVEYANKLASIGRLAAGVAHEINNPLAVINEKAGFIKDLFAFKGEYVKDRKLLDNVDSILSAVERGGRITRRLLRFARHMDINIETIDLQEVIYDILGFLGKEAEYKSIEVSVDIAQNIPPFETDRGKLQQILLNIINNSFAALSEGGRLEIKAVRENINSVSIICRDNGCGISAENLEHVFEPFFSTKTNAGGTGLGLSITYGLVQEIGGRIEVKSEINKGTTFTVVLPFKMPLK